MFAIPSKNPKHRSRKAQIERQQEYSEKAPMNLRLLLMGIIFIVVVGIVIFIIIYGTENQNPNQNGDQLIVENGDLISFSYEIWLDSDNDGTVEWDPDSPPDFDGSLTRKLYYQPSAENNTFSEQFYNQILGSKQDGNPIWIELDHPLDEDDDGYDDTSGEKIVGFKAEFPNQNILIKILITDIEKP